jgi:hypothetical protein
MVESVLTEAARGSGVNEFLARALDDYRNGWSIGTFGVIGEFVFGPEEPADKLQCWAGSQTVTSRGGIRILPRDDLRAVAYDTLVSDGETWGNAVAFCLPAAGAQAGNCVRRIGPDVEALRAEDRDAVLFDLGVGVGHVTLCSRTKDVALIAALESVEGKKLLGPEGATVRTLSLQTSPNRVLLSPAGRIEVYAPIPPPDGKSPSGPHTHLLPKLIASGRTHSANAPIPEGLQPVLMMHPRSPWRDADGIRTPYDARQDQSFESILSVYGLEQDRLIRAAVEKAVSEGHSPHALASPASRRGRAQLRITLRRLAQRLGQEAVAGWKALYDPATHESDDPGAAAHG